MKSFRQYLAESKKIVENSIKKYTYADKYKMVPFENIKRGDIIFSMNPSNKFIEASPYVVERVGGGVIQAGSLGGPGFYGTMTLTKDSDPLVPAIQDKRIAQKACDEWMEDTFGNID